MNLDGTRFPVGPHCESSKCKNAQLVWAKTSGGKPILVHAVPTPDGTIRLSDNGQPEPLATTLTVHQRATVAWGSLHLAHYATCPDAARYRKKARTS